MLQNSKIFYCLLHNLTKKGKKITEFMFHSSIFFYRKEIEKVFLKKCVFLLGGKEHFLEDFFCWCIYFLIMWKKLNISLIEYILV